MGKSISAGGAITAVGGIGQTIADGIMGGNTLESFGKDINKLIQDSSGGNSSDKVEIDISKIIESATSAKKGGETVAGHALQKHAGRNPDIWGKPYGNAETINNTAKQHIDDILNGTGEFRVVKSNGHTFLEKMLPDRRGLRLNMNSTFKGFIDQTR